MSEINLRKITDYVWEIPKHGDMLVPARIYASEKMLKNILADNAPQQAANVAHLPGIVGYSLAMPDIHWGYGFPIGGVAAFDVDSGVVSPGGVGYDINCLAGDAQVLSEHGYTRPIEQLEKNRQSINLRCHDFAAGHEAATAVVGYLRRRPATPIYRMTVETGNEIVATADHPFWTPDGMIELRWLRVGDRVACHSFAGVAYEEPTDKIILDINVISQTLSRHGKGEAGNALTQILNRLQERRLLPLRCDSPQLPALLKLLGYVFGDGSIHYSGGVAKGVTWFYGDPEDLEAIRNDVAETGFTPSRIYARDRKHRVTTTYDVYEFERREYAFKVVGSSFATLLAALGAPVGNKAKQDFGVPPWLFEVPLWQRRLFLAAFFGAELSSPRAFIERNHNFMSPVLSINKREKYKASGHQFLHELSRLLEGFGVKLQKISERPEQQNVDGSRSIRLRMILSSKTESLFNLWGRIGFEYNRKRQALANVAAAYLKCKAAVVHTRNRAAQRAKALQATGAAPQDIYPQLVGAQVNRRFIERSLYGDRAGSPRVGQSFMTFDEYRADAAAGLGDSGMVWSRIIRKEETALHDEVYDLTVDHHDHNFVANGFVVSNCGVRLMASDMTKAEVTPKIEKLVATLYNNVPTGVGMKGRVKLSEQELKRVMSTGAEWAVQNGYGDHNDLEFIEERGKIAGADDAHVSPKARERGRPQLGTLGSGNHFLEVGYVSEIYDQSVAQVLGLFPGQVTVIIHCGSRGFGHQICEDFLGVMDQAVKKYGISLPDRQLACAPLSSPEGRNYLGAMKSAVNFAFANRQIIAHWTRESFNAVFKKSPRAIGMRNIYEVAHNIAKIETHTFEGEQRKVCVHRKGATRAFPAGHAHIPAAYQAVGQPVLIPGDMGRCSYVLVGAPGSLEQTFGSTCHGAGRAMSRHQAKKTAKGRNIAKELQEQGIYVMGASRRTLDEEIPEAYKDVSQVVDTCEMAGISKKVAQLRPLGCIKG